MIVYYVFILTVLFAFAIGKELETSNVEENKTRIHRPHLRTVDEDQEASPTNMGDYYYNDISYQNYYPYSYYYYDDDSYYGDDGSYSSTYWDPFYITFDDDFWNFDDDDESSFYNIYNDDDQSYSIDTDDDGGDDDSTYDDVVYYSTETTSSEPDDESSDVSVSELTDIHHIHGMSPKVEEFNVISERKSLRGCH